jgi:multicomponent Na+:H+ antiporter subunit B
VTRRARIGLFLAGAAGLAVLLAFGVSGLHAFGHYPGPYGIVLNHVELRERHATNVVSAVVFDYRGFDTLGEELILFCAVIGTSLLLRSVREEDVTDVRDAARSEALRAVGLVTVPVVVLLALDVAAHGYVTPGGGFQGGVVAAAGLFLVYLAGEWRALRHAAPERLVDACHSFGAGGFAAVGIGTLAAGAAFLENVLPLGRTGTLKSAGTIPVVNLCAAIEVTAAFVLLFTEFATELLVERKHAGEA